MANGGRRDGASGRRASDDDARAVAAPEIARCAGARSSAVAGPPDNEIDLAEGALLIAAEEYPGPGRAAYLAPAGRPGQAGAPVPGQAPGPARRGAVLDADEAGLHALHTVLFEEEGFIGAPPGGRPTRATASSTRCWIASTDSPSPSRWCTAKSPAAPGWTPWASPSRATSSPSTAASTFSVYVDPFNGGAPGARRSAPPSLGASSAAEFELRPEHFLPASRAILTRILDNLKMTTSSAAS